MTDIIRTNYCTHAMDSLVEQARAIRADGAPEIADTYFSIVSALNDAVKYLLPERGDMIAPQDLGEAHLELLSLPAPCIVLESFWREDDKLPTRGGVEVTHAQKRIALCWDPEKYKGPVAAGESCSKQYDGGGICVLPIYQTVAGDQWHVAHGVEFVPYNTPLVKGIKPDTEASRIAAEMQEKEGFKGGTWGKKVDCFPTIPALLPHLAQHYGSVDAVKASIMLENWDETYMLIQACAVLQCANVETETISPPDKLNKSRLAKGLAPFFEYQVMTLSAERTGGEKKMHLRRGHMRRLSDRVIWVRPAIIGKFW
ncbi:hypothetical protein [Acetobacter malorum]|nr:hypothetical protein [Acetobacter malorum]